MVNGPSPGPAPAAQACTSSCRLTRSSWRTCPHRKLRRKVPRVDGAFTVQPNTAAVLPVGSPSASSMQSPPARADATRVITLSPTLARPGASPRSTWRSTSWGRPRSWARVAGRISPALLTKRWSSKAIRMRRRWLRGSIYWVLLSWASFLSQKPLSQNERNTFISSQPTSTLISSVDSGQAYLEGVLRPCEETDGFLRASSFFWFLIIFNEFVIEDLRQRPIAQGLIRPPVGVDLELFFQFQASPSGAVRDIPATGSVFRDADCAGVTPCTTGQPKCLKNSALPFPGSSPLARRRLSDSDSIPFNRCK